VMAKMVKSLLACRNGFGPTDEDVRMEELGGERQPTGEDALRWTVHNEAEHTANRQQ